MSQQFDTIVIGGGASGMMAAGRAAERGRKVLLLEKNTKLGKKLAISGGGRCNICNAEEDEHQLLSQYGTAKKFLHSSFAQFGMKETFSFFSSRGLQLKVEARNRVFPVTEKAVDVVLTLEEYLSQGNVEVRTGATVNGFLHEEGKITGIDVDGGTLTAESYVLATGGTSHPETGSTGDGFRWLTDLGHRVQRPTPAVVPIAVEDSWVKSLSGVAVESVKLTLFVDEVKALKLSGRVLFTHFGLSGPTILNASANIAELLQEGEVTARMDLFPELDLGALDKRVIGIFDDNKNRDLKNVLKVVAPLGMAPALLMLLPHIDPLKKVHSISQQERKTLVNLLKALPMTVTGLMGMDRAVIVDGGLSLEEVDGKTFRSRLFDTLYVTGDVLHINRPSGGFSLQLCWTSGYVAGSHA